MRMKKLFSHLLLFLSVILGGCLDPYNPPAVTSPEKYLVVDGFINSGSGPTVFRLSYSMNIGDTSSTEIGDAKVFVEGKTGAKFELHHTGKGQYKTDQLSLNPSEEYRLNIILSNNKEYESEYVVVKDTPEIDSVSWEKTKDGIQIFVTTHDPKAKTKYYAYEYDEAWKFHSAFYSGLKMEADGSIVYRPPDQQIYYCFQFSNSKNINVATSEHLSQDVIYKYPLTSVSAIQSNKLSVKYSILVKQQAVTHQAFQYWDNLRKVTEDVGSLFDPQPITFSGNISSTTDKNELVLGFVSAGNKKEKRIFITREQVGFTKVYTGYELCEQDTVPSKKKPTIGGGDIPITTTSGPGGGTLLLVGSSGCVDCMLKGTVKEPEFWQ
jgi:hypothetical protein